MPGQPLTAEDRDRVLAGLVSLAELADQRGISRQAAHQAFRRRGWATRPPAEDRQEVGKPTLETPLGVAKAPKSLPRPPGAPRSAASASAGVSVPETPESRPAAAPAPPSAPIGLLWGDGSDLAEITRHELANLSLLQIDQARQVLASPRPIGPQGLRSIGQALDGALARLEKLGVPVVALDLPPELRVEFAEMSAEELAAIQAEAEHGHREIEPGDEDEEDAA